MNPPPRDRWQQLDALFAEALARPPDERTAFLRATCGDDPALYAEVLALLEDTGAAERALGESVTDYAAPLLPGLRTALEESQASGELAPGTALGPYRIEGVLGRGGMGTVYLAERADGAFQKRVALKVVRRGLDTDDVLARFRRERQLLAGLDHPHIARLLDGGATDDGRPFLVLEHVEGEPLTAYCDRRRLTVDARLALLAQVGEAVQHAHRRLVVHRDLKPSNVLVREDEAGAPQVKLLDFGVAKLLDPDARGEGAHTWPGLRLLTPEYAAPEQLRGEAVTTAADVYALGVLLYELLAGRRPARAAEAATPEPPSAAVTADAARARATTAERLRRRLRGDLDTICLKALRGEPDRRYPSAEALLEDLRRHQAGLPVRARPETAAYRARTFVRRHRAGVAASAAFVALLVGALVAVALQQRATARERDRAEGERAAAAETAAFLESLLAASDPFGEERLDTLRVRDLLDRGAVRVREEFAAQPLVRARLLHTIGRTYLRIGLPAEAEPLLREAAARRADAPAADRAASLTALATVRRTQGAHAEAEALARDALALLGPGTPADTRAAAEAELALALMALGRHAEAEPVLRAAYDRLQAAHGPDDARALDAETKLAELFFETGRLADAEARYRDVLARLRLLDAGPHPRHAAVLNPLAFLLMVAGRAEEAVAFSTEGVALTRAGAPGSSRLRQALVGHAGILRRLARYRDAEAALAEALALPARWPPDQALALGALASVYADRGDVAAAVATQRDALAVLRESLGDDDPVTAQSAMKLAVLLQRKGAWAEAERLLLDAYAVLRGAPSEHGGGGAQAARALAALYAAWGRPEEASRYRRAAAQHD